MAIYEVLVVQKLRARRLKGKMSEGEIDLTDDQDDDEKILVDKKYSAPSSEVAIVKAVLDHADALKNAKMKDLEVSSRPLSESHDEY